MKAVYGILNSMNGKMYVGSTTNYGERKNKHFKNLRKGRSDSNSLQKDFDIYGENKFSIFVIEEINSDEDIFLEKEDEYVLKFNTLMPYGYNEVLPSSKNDSPLKKSESSKKYYQNHAPNNLKKLTPEEWLTKKKENPDFKLSRVLNGERSTKVYEINKDNFGIIQCFNSVIEVQSLCKVTESTLRISLNKNKNKPYHFSLCKNKVFIRVEDYIFPLLSEKPIKEKKEKVWKKVENPIPYSERNIKRTPISFKNIKTNEIKDFNSKAEAAKFLICQPTKINSLIKGWENKGRGRIFKITNIKGWTIFTTH